MKDLLKFIFGGITVGITFLMIGYICVFYIAGEEVFLQEISRLQQIHILQYQLIISGTSGVLMALSIYNYGHVRKCEKQSAYKNILGIILMLIASFITMALTSTMNKNISDMMLVIEVVLFSMYCLTMCVREAWDEFIINKKIKEKNSQPEKGNK